MKLCIHKEATDFLDSVYGLLMQDEVLNNLPLGVAQAVRDGKVYGEGEPFFASVQEGSQVVSSFLRTPPYALHVFSEKDYQSESFAMLVQFFAKEGMSLPGVIGAKEQTESFAEAWCRASGKSWKLGKGMRVFRLDEVTHSPEILGGLELARLEQVDLLVAWVAGFQATVGDVRDKENVRNSVLEMIEKKSLYLWMDPGKGPVSCACNLRKIVSGEVINLVYTPPELRGNGFASAAVATLSQALLDEGAAFCCLFTDNENPISNKIYQRIGYRPVADYSMLNFV